MHKRPIYALLVFLLLTAGASAQTYKVIATYNTDRFIIKTFSPELEYIGKTEINLLPLRGKPSWDPFHGLGTYRCMQLSSDGSEVMFTLLPTDDSAKVVTFYRCTLPGRKISALFTIPYQPGVYWQWVEARHSVVYFDARSSAFYEYHLDRNERDTLCTVIPDHRYTSLQCDSSKLEFVFQQNDSIFHLVYSFLTKEVTRNFVYGFTFFNCWHNGHLLITRTGDDPLTRVVTQRRAVTRILAPNSSDAQWVLPDKFCMAEANALCLYDPKLMLKRSYFMTQPKLYGAFADGYLVRYSKNTDRIFAFVDAGLTRTYDLPEVADNFLMMLADYR